MPFSSGAFAATPVLRSALAQLCRFRPSPPRAQIFDQIIFGMFIFLLGNLALLGIKKFAYAPILIIPILLLVLFRYVAGKAFGRPMKTLAAHAAADLDRGDEACRRARAVPSACRPMLLSVRIRHSLAGHLQHCQGRAV